MKAVVFDTETTGLTLPAVTDLDKQPRIIEIGAAIVNSSGEVEATFSELIHPGVQITDEITKITGITNDDLIGRPTFADVLPRLRDFFLLGPDYLIAHNAEFDTSLLRFELARIGVTDFPMPRETICTVAEYQHVFGRNARLVELYALFVGKPLAQTHRALDDVMALVEMARCAKLFEVIA